MADNGKIRLETAVDGRETHGEALEALLQDVRQWSKPFGTNGTEMDRESLMSAPAQFRGNLIRWSGKLELTREASPWIDVQEWFVRMEDGQLVILIVAGSCKAHKGEQVSGIARFYKTVSLEGRDAQIRVYPTFVTTALAIATTSTGPNVPAFYFLLPVLFVVSLIVYICARLMQPKKQTRRSVHIQTDDVVDAMENYASDLPDNASQALAQMYEQVEDET
ncbi:MAG: hypothetical protein CMJ26_05110 [Phycisphaerae bacterium]|nr:hypothetical protein [Phycisphaerae bacterium]|tara:strand:+ start:394 stop:1056 length:663 start_codon:yes stop_codon:yes gene_type:complete